MRFLALLSLSLAASADPQGATDPPSPEAGMQARTDRHGDALPAGAIARLGTVRLRHGSPVHSLAFAPGGKALASAGDDAVRLWETATGKELRRFPRGGQCVAFSPDGRLLAAASHDGPIRLWETATGRLSRQLGPQAEVYTIAFAPDGKTLASGGRSGTVSFDDVATGKRLHQWRVPGRLASVAFSPDGSLLASATTGGQVQVWELATRRELPRFQGRKLPGTHVTFSPDGRLLAAAPVSGGFGLWEVASGKEVRREAKGYGEVVFSPDGQTLAAPDLGAIRLWETASGKPVAALPWRQRPPAHVRFSSDGTYLAAAGAGGPAVTVWELATGKEVSPLPAHRDPIRAVALAPDRQVLASVGSGGGAPAALTLWQVPTGRELRRLAGPGGPVPAVLFAAGGRVVIAGPGADGAVRRWEAGTGKELPWVQGLFPKTARALVVSPDGQAFAVSSSNHSIHLYDSSSGKRRGTLGVAPGAGQVLALSPGARLVAYAEGGGAVVLADTARGKVLYQAHHEAVRALAFSPDGQLLATGGSGPIRLWQVRTGKQRSSLAGHGDPGQTTAVAFSPDGRALASAGYDSTVRVWERATCGQRLLFRPSQPASCLTFSLDGTLLASGSYDTTVLVWDLTGRSAEQRLGGKAKTSR